MTIKWQTGLLDAMVKGTASLSVGCAVLSVAAFSALANSCERPKLFFYYSEVMGTSLGVSFVLAILCLVFHSHSLADGPPFIFENLTVGKRIWVRVVLIFIAALMFIAVFGLQNLRDDLLSLPITWNNAVSIEDFCKKTEPSL